MPHYRIEELIRQVLDQLVDGFEGGAAGCRQAVGPPTSLHFLQPLQLQSLDNSGGACCDLWAVPVGVPELMYQVRPDDFNSGDAARALQALLLLFLLKTAAMEWYRLGMRYRHQLARPGIGAWPYGA